MTVSMLLALLIALTIDAPATDLAVTGVVVRQAPGRSTAILSSGGRTRIATVGDAVFGGRVTAIAADAVTLDFGGERLVLRLPASAPPAPASRTPAGPAHAALPAGAPPEDPATPARSMERVEVQRRLGDEIPRILAETTIAPVMEDGRVTGVQVARLPEGSLLTDAGLRAGDVITEINGTQIDGMATLVGLWPRLQAASELRAVVVRNGQPVSLLVSLK